MSIREDIEKVQNKVEEIEHQSLAMEILKEQRKSNKRLFIALIVVLCMWFATIGYLVYVLNDIGVVEEVTTQEVKDIDSVGGNIINRGERWEQ